MGKFLQSVKPSPLSASTINYEQTSTIDKEQKRNKTKTALNEKNKLVLEKITGSGFVKF